MSRVAMTVPVSKNSTVVQWSNHVITGGAGDERYSMNGTRVFVCAGHRARIRQKGRITQATIHWKHLHADDTVRIGVYRPTATDGVFDFVAESPDITTSLVDDAVVTYTGLSLPCEIGDCLSFRITAADADNIIRNRITLTGDNPTQDWRVYWADTTVDGWKQVGPPYNTDAATSPGTAECLYVSAFGICPVWIAAGDSFMEGSIDTGVLCRSSLTPLATGKNWLSDLDLTANILGYLHDQDATLFNYMNHAEGGTTGADWASTYLTTKIMNFYPRAVLLSVGYNDIGPAFTSGNWTESTKYLTAAALSAYTYVSGDIVTLTAGTGVARTQYTIASKPNSTTIALASDINPGAGDIVDSSISGLCSRSWATMVSNFHTIVQTLRANNIQPAFITILHKHGGTAAELKAVRTWNYRLAEWCRQQEVPLFDAWNVLASATDRDVRNETLFGSSTHPTNAGYQAIARAIAGQIVAQR